MNAINNKIISRFYVITLNKKPVYVGYTNRPIRQRFNEHKRDKDFGNIEPEIEQIAQSEYDFTWDTNKIDKYANEVNNKECELIEQYNTQNSKYQKANGGGQNWNDIKYFVNTNYNNPKFLNMSENDVLTRISKEHSTNKQLTMLIHNMDNPVASYLKNFVITIKKPTDIYLNNFVNNIHEPITIYISSFISRMNEPTTIYMNTFVNRMRPKSEDYLKNFIHNMNEPITVYIKDFVKSMNLPTEIYIGHFINAMHTKCDAYLLNSVNHIKDVPSTYVITFISSMLLKPEAYIKSFTKNI